MNIKREQVVSMIHNLKNGSIYSVKFIKKDGTERLMNSIKGTSKGVTGVGKKFNDEELAEDYSIEDFVDYHNENSKMQIDWVVSDFIQL